MKLGDSFTVMHSLRVLAFSAALLCPTGCLVSFPDYAVGDLSGAGGRGASGRPDASTGGGEGTLDSGMGGGALGGGGGSGEGGTGGEGEGGGASGGTAGASAGGADAGVGPVDAGPSCTDGIVNGAETDIDCGGPACPKCEVGATCKVPEDCTISFCIGNV